MSEERRKRQQAKQPKGSLVTPEFRRKIIVAVLLAAALGAVYYLGIHNRNHRYDAFAKCTAERGARMYGAFWCPHCQEQKEAFADSFEYVNYIECGVKGDHKGQTQACKDAGIVEYPTWEFLDQSRVKGKQTFPFLSEKTGCPLP